MDYALNADGHRGGVVSRAWERASAWGLSMREDGMRMRERLRTVAQRPEEGAVTAEYAVVLIAATGFAALLVVLLKSNAVRDLLTDLVKKALNVG